MVLKSSKSVDDSCNTHSIVNKFNYTFSIENFSHHLEKTGEKIISPTFVVGWRNKSEWCLWIYPNGDKEESKEYVSVYLRLLKPEKAEAKFRFSILNDKEEEKNVYRSEMIKEFVKDKGSSSWGFHKFVNRDFLLNESNDLLINNKLTIFCEAEISEPRSENHDNSETSINITIPQSKLVSNYCNMFESSLFTDCIIRVEGTEIKAHKAVLAAQSSVFYEVFCNSKEETQTDVVEIKDFRPEVVREMLRYIYTENVSNIQNIAGDVLAIADRYKLDRLKAISERSLCYSLDIMNVCERFALSEKYSTGTLQECCQELILENAAWLAKTKEWKKFVLVRPLLLESLFLKSLNTSSVGNI